MKIKFQLEYPSSTQDRDSDTFKVIDNDSLTLFSHMSGISKEILSRNDTYFYKSDVIDSYGFIAKAHGWEFEFVSHYKRVFIEDLSMNVVLCDDGNILWKYEYDWYRLNEREAVYDNIMNNAEVIKWNRKRKLENYENKIQ